MFTRLLAILAVLLVAGAANGMEQARSSSHTGGATFTMCEAEPNTGTCDSAGGVDLYAMVPGYAQYTIYFSQTGIDATCDIYAADKSLVSASPAELTSSLGTKINSVPLSSTVTALSYEAPFYMLWVICTAGSGNHTVAIQAK